MIKRVVGIVEISLVREETHIHGDNRAGAQERAVSTGSGEERLLYTHSRLPIRTGSMSPGGLLEACTAPPNGPSARQTTSPVRRSVAIAAKRIGSDSMARSPVACTTKRRILLPPKSPRRGNSAPMPPAGRAPHS